MVATLALSLFALLAIAPAAHGQLVGEFYARLEGIKLWGAYTAVLESRVYETDGSPPPDLEHAEIHFPGGAGIRERFLRPRFYCDAAKLATAVVLVHSNQQSHAYDFQVLDGNLFRESGRFGYRLELPVKVRPILPTIKLRLAELSLTLRGLRTAVHGRKVFWTKVPRCPHARRVSFGADYEFEGKTPIRKRRRINCRRFVRRPAVERHGRIPGAPT